MPLKKKKLPQYCGSFFMSCRHVEKAPMNRYDKQRIDNNGCNYAANRSVREFGLFL